MEKWPKEFAQNSAFMMIGVFFGIIGNFMAISIYRIIDHNPTSMTPTYDWIAFFFSLGAIIVFSSYIYMKMKDTT